jgi:hypothetical protein
MSQLDGRLAKALTECQGLIQLAKTEDQHCGSFWIADIGFQVCFCNIPVLFPRHGAGGVHHTSATRGVYTSSPVPNQALRRLRLCREPVNHDPSCLCCLVGH